MEIIRQLKINFILLLIFTLLTGLIYPFVVTCLAQLIFPWQANGSLLEQNGKCIGSLLIGQSFNEPQYFWGRPSATSPFPYNAANSSGSNLGPTNPNFLAAVKERVSHIQQSALQKNQLIPVDLVTTSGSGLDPEISPLAAFYQVPRVAKARHLPEQQINELVLQHITHRFFHLFGEPRINVLQLNLDLDKLRNRNVNSTSKS